MISITTKSRYAVSAMAELAGQGMGQPMPVSELARRRNIPVQFLEQLFANLRRAGLVTSQRGVHGGYFLARPAEQISVLQIVEVLDGQLGGSPVPLSAPWGAISTDLRSQLGGISIEDVRQGEVASAEGPMYYI